MVILLGRRCEYTILVGNPNGKKPLASPRRRLEKNIKLILKKNLESLDWIDLAEDCNNWQVYARQVMKFRVPENVGNFLNI